MKIDLNIYQLSVINMALANFQPVSPELINETKQIVESSIKLYPGAPESEAKPILIGFNESCLIRANTSTLEYWDKPKTNRFNTSKEYYNG